jgi:biotin carboxyl carrier protein
MLPDRQGHVHVRASFAGTVELKVRAGERVEAGQSLCVVEGDKEIETLSARNAGVVREVAIRDGSDVEKGALILTLAENRPAASA